MTVADTTKIFNFKHHIAAALVDVAYFVSGQLIAGLSATWPALPAAPKSPAPAQAICSDEVDLTSGDVILCVITLTTLIVGCLASWSMQPH